MIQSVTLKGRDGLGGVDERILLNWILQIKMRVREMQSADKSQGLAAGLVGQGDQYLSFLKREECLEQLGDSRFLVFRVIE
jgi:hypothetical protein